jgi:phage RecT family recombinase
MTAPARAAAPQSRQQPAATLVNLSLLDRVIEETILTKDGRRRLQPFMTSGQSYDRVAAQVRESMIKVPKLAQSDPDTLIDAVVTIQRWGLEIGETAYLVPYGENKSGRVVVTPVRSYLGDIELLIANGVARDVVGECVFKNERFIYEEGLSPKLEHHPLEPSKRGEMIGAYGIVWITSSYAKSKFLFLEEIELLRETFSKQWKQEQVGRCPEWYAIKCGIKAATKLLPKSPRLRKVQEQIADDDMAVESARRALNSYSDRPAHITADGEDLAEPAQSEAPAAERPAAKANGNGAPACPKCGAGMYDNRKENAERKARGEKPRPDFKCKNRQCDGVIWHQEKEQPSESAPSAGDQPPPPDEDLVLDQQLLEDEARQASPPGSKSHAVPTPGKIQDALDLNDQPKRRNRDALREG